MIATGGDAKVLWPAMEGVLIEDADMRENGPIKYNPMEYPTKGWEGLYPGPCPTQFMAYYDKNGGLYFGAHEKRRIKLNGEEVKLKIKPLSALMLEFVK